MNKHWQTIASEYVVKDRWLTLRADRCVTPSGVAVEPYYVQELPEWVNIVAFDEQQRILLIEQYRHGIGEVTLEVPAGCVDNGEDPEIAAKRELLEETGCEVSALCKLPVQLPNPARSTNRMHQFVGIGARLVGAQNLDTSEAISFRFVPAVEVLRMIDSGEFCMSLHITNILMGIRHLNALGRQRAIDWREIPL